MGLFRGRRQMHGRAWLPLDVGRLFGMRQRSRLCVIGRLRKHHTYVVISDFEC